LSRRGIKNTGGASIEPKKDRLKILFLPAWYPSDADPVAGVFVREHAKAAALYNDIVVVYASADDSLSPWKRPVVTEDVEDGIRTIRIKFGRYRPIAAILRNWLFKHKAGSAREGFSTGNSGIGKTVKELLTLDGTIVDDILYYRSILRSFDKLVDEGWKPDVIHGHVFVTSALAAILGRLNRIPVVVTEHSSSVTTHSLGWLLGSHLRFAAGHAEVVLPVSHYLRTAIEEHYGVKGTFVVVPNVVNTDVFYPSRPRCECEAEAKKRMLLVAIQGPRKGIPDLLQALIQVREKRPDFILDIVGDGPCRVEHEAQAAKLGLANQVKFHGQKSKQEVGQFMRDCDFFVLPSLGETFGVVYIEAMACGKPVIATNAGGPKDFVNKEVGIMVPPGDIQALKEAIEYMMDHYQSYSPEEIHGYAVERFSYGAVGKMLNTVYRTVV
jgi:glycosyltransferase involved in cell wall biosynthesis